MPSPVDAPEMLMSICRNDSGTEQEVQIQLPLESEMFGSRPEFQNSGFPLHYSHFLCEDAVTSL